MAFKYDKLRGRIVEKYRTLGNFASEIGLSMNSMSKKMSCQTGFSQKDICKWAELLDIPVSQFGEYFFE